MRNTLSIRLRSLAVASLALTSLTAGAQVVTGRVTDTDGKPLAFANIVALRAADSTFVAGTVTDADGRYRLDTKGGGLLRVSLIGYGQTFRTVAQATAMNFALAADARLLGEATVTGSRPFAYIKDDALVTNVEGTVLARMPRVNDMLGRIPGLTKTADGIEVFGKGAPVIYINSRKVRDASELDRLAPEDVKSVEVITNPGARYGADVRAVVRIRTVKRQGEGVSVRNDAYLTSGHNTNASDRLSLNYRKNGWDVSASGYYGSGRWRTRQHSTETRFAPFTLGNKNTSTLKGSQETYNFTASINYDFNENHSVGARYESSLLPHATSNVSSTVLTFRQSQQEDQLTTNSHAIKDDRPTHSANLYYAGQAGQWGIDFNADLYQTDTRSFTDVDEVAIKGGDRDFTKQNKNQNRLYAAKLVVTHPLWQGSLSVGTEYTFTQSYGQNLNEAWVPSSESYVKEASTAVFADYARTFGKLQAKVGVRYENVNSNYYEFGHYVVGQSRTYNDVFPSASLAWPVGKVQMQLSYAAKIERPSYYSLRSDIQYNDRYTYEAGNPLLRPTKKQDVALVAAWKWMQFVANYTEEKDPVALVQEIYDASQEIVLYSHENLNKRRVLTAQLSAGPRIGFWTPKASVGVQKQFFKAPWRDGSLRMNKPAFFGSLQNQFKIDDTWYAFLDVHVTSAGHSMQIAARKDWMMNVSVNKTFLHNTLVVNLGVNDILNTSRQRWTMYSPYVINNMYKNNDPRYVYLSVSYRFNAAKSRYKGTGAGSSQRSRM